MAATAIETHANSYEIIFLIEAHLKSKSMYK